MKILVEVLLLLMLSQFKHITTEEFEEPTLVSNERLRSTILGQYNERNETKFSKKRPKRFKMHPKMESSCRNCGLIYRRRYKALIIRGDPVQPTYLYPWMVAMTKDGKVLCTGAIINAYFILTASHCLVKNLNEHKVLEPQTKPLVYFQPKDVEISLLTLTEKLRPGPPVQKVIPHTRFKPSEWEHDIGLIKLKEKIICTKLSNPICLPPPDLHLPKDSEMIISGFGSYNGSPDAVGMLRRARVKEERFENCPYPRRMKEGFYCLKSVKQGQVACYGDSGGPMFYEHKDKFYILGVSSFGKSCDTKLPFLYTSVPHHLRWIHKNMASSSTEGKGLSGSSEKGKCKKDERKLNRN